jgi:hypothetical protein
MIQNVSNSLKPSVYASGIVSGGRIVYRHKKKNSIDLFIYIFSLTLSHTPITTFVRTIGEFLRLLVLEQNCL